MSFYKATWHIICNDIQDYINELFTKAHLPKAFAADFIALIPKSHNPQTINEFRPITLITSVYKIISKLLPGRLRNVIGKLVSINQYAFITDKSLLDGVLVVNKVVDYARRKNVAFKVDF